MTELLSQYTPISLEEMSGIRLMNRIDTKFLTTRLRLQDLLRLAKDNYFIQEIDGMRNMPYYTLYYDTPTCDMYITHQNGKKTRQKIRIRSYVNSGINYLEVKNKNNRGRTKKKRIEIERPDISQASSVDFLKQYSRYRISLLTPTLETRFDRITLVNKNKTERLTIDTNLRFNNQVTGETILLDRIAIIELKRDGNVYSPIKNVLNDLRIHPAKFSKYCMGMVLTNESLKQNRFKRRVQTMKKLNIID